VYTSTKIVISSVSIASQNLFIASAFSHLTNKLSFFSRLPFSLPSKVTQDEDVSITLDHWTSSANVNYVAQTAHFIDGDFKLTKLTLACTQHKGSSTGADSKQVTSHSSDTIIVY
jgi:hypothetical protein